jgi:hypothetical protein
MRNRSGVILGIGALLMATAACTGSSTKPTGTTSIVAPNGVVPVNNSTIPYANQPVTLSVANATVTVPGTTTYTFEVSTDSGFATKTQTKADIAEGSSATNVKLDQLAGAASYYWHARATSGGTVGAWGPTYKFTVGPPIVINAPALASPANGAAQGSMPTLVVANAQKSGPAGALTYRFEVSASPTFSPAVLDVNVPEGGGGSTGLISPVEMPAETTVYWRVTAFDQANGVSSPVSTTGQFVTSLSIDLSKVFYLASPDISGWKRTGYLISVEQDGNEAAGGPLCTDFTDPGWPDSPWVYGTDPTFGVFANQWYFAKIGGTWYGGAGEWIYRTAPSKCKAGQGTTTLGPDSGFGAPFSSWQPKVGELVGYAISAVARKGSIARTVSERTQVVVQPWKDTSRGSPIGLTFGFVNPTAKQ